MHLALNFTGLNPTKMVSGDIKNRRAFTNLKEIQVFCKKKCFLKT
jgi:hypothetical protein